MCLKMEIKSKELLRGSINHVNKKLHKVCQY